MAWRRGQAYGQDLRDRVLACADMTLVEVATRFDVSPSSVSKVLARLRVLGQATSGAQRGHLPLRLAEFTDALQARIKASPDATLNELADLAVADASGQCQLSGDVESRGPPGSDAQKSTSRR